MKYKDLLEEWLDDCISISVKQRTYQRYKEIIELHIIPFLGDYDISNITYFIIQKYIAYIFKKKSKATNNELSANTINGIISLIKSSFKYALLRGLINENITDKIKRPKNIEKKVECFTLKEQKKIEEYILFKNKDYLYGIIISFYTGLRIGELLALEWSDIDFNKLEMYINKTSYYGKDKNDNYTLLIDKPKTNNSIRVIPISKSVLKILKDLRKRRTCNYVISNYNKQMNIRSYQRIFSTILNKLSIEHKGFHSIRHTFATRALECNMDIKTLSEILGHKNSTITLNRYAHSLMKHKREMMDKVGKILIN